MNFNERNSIPSCSSLGRIRNCGGSWALSKGVPDTTSKDAEKGNDVHDCLKQIVLGGLKNPKNETEQLAWRLWDHIRNAAFNHFGDIDLVWEAEKRLWMTNDDLEPILSGQFDVICYSKDRELSEEVAIFDAKTGWLAGDVPTADRNWQMQGLAELVAETYCRYPVGAIVREWACDDLVPLGDAGARQLAEAVNRGEYDVWHRAGLRTGEWCQFCPAKGNCPAYRDAFQIVAKNPDDVNQLLEVMSPEYLVRILRASPMAEKVIEAAKNEAHRRREAGEELPNVVWVKGNTKRTIKAADAIMMRMKALGIEVPTKIDVKLSDIEAAYGKINNLKGKPLKDKFNKEFAEFLAFSENAPSITFAE